MQCSLLEGQQRKLSLFRLPTELPMTHKPNTLKLQGYSETKSEYSIYWGFSESICAQQGMNTSDLIQSPWGLKSELE